MGYESGFLRTLESVVDDMERKIKRQHDRLEHDERYMKAVSVACLLSSASRVTRACNNTTIFFSYV